MYNFIQNIFDFVRDIFYYFRQVLFNESNLEANRTLGVGYGSFDNFLSKNVFLESSLIGINIQYRELLIYIPTFILTGLFIYLFIKFVYSLITIITDGVTKWR